MIYYYISVKFVFSSCQHSSISEDETEVNLGSLEDDHLITEVDDSFDDVDEVETIYASSEDVTNSDNKSSNEEQVCKSLV